MPPVVLSTGAGAGDNTLAGSLPSLTAYLALSLAFDALDHAPQR
jgi:hypothetical protein